MADQYLSVSEYARHRGCDEKAVRKAVAEGRIVAVEQDGKRRIDPVAADAQWAANTRARVRPRVVGAALADAVSAPLASAPPKPDVGRGDYNMARARRELAEAEEAELRVARAAGRALDRERAERGAFDAFRELRDGSFAAMKSAARKVIGLTEVREVEIALEDELRGAFAGWEDRMRARLAEGDAAHQPGKAA